MDIYKIEKNKNGLCVLNLFVFLFAVYKLNVPITIKNVFGLLVVSLGPIFWNEWLYSGLIESESKKKVLPYSAFIYVGLSMPLLVLASTFYGYINGTL